MAAFKTTPVAIPQADQPTIVQRFLSTSERFLFHPAAAGSVQVRAHVRGPGLPYDNGRHSLPLPRCSQLCEQGRAAA